jgi:hypothetical protein
MKDYKPPFMSHLLLSHLSKNNNDPILVKDLFSPVAGTTEIIIASRYTETPLLYINSSVYSNDTRKSPVKANNGSHDVPVKDNLQLSLF